MNKQVVADLRGIREEVLRSGEKPTDIIRRRKDTYRGYQCADALRAALPAGYINVVVFEDAPGRSTEDIVALIDRAIAGKSVSTGKGPEITITDSVRKEWLLRLAGKREGEAIWQSL